MQCVHPIQIHLRHYNQWGFVNSTYTQINGEVVNGLNNHTFKKIAENVKQVVTCKSN